MEFWERVMGCLVLPSRASDQDLLATGCFSLVTEEEQREVHPSSEPERRVLLDGVP